MYICSFFLPDAKYGIIAMTPEIFLAILHR
jgi:hypothetical protein